MDYQENDPVHKYLAQKFAADPFDAIIDCFGAQEIFKHSASYLKHSMPYVTFGPAPAKTSFPSLFYVIGQMLSNKLWPRFLGGVNRPYVLVAAPGKLPGMKRLARLVEGGALKVPIDSVWEFEDALKVCVSMWLEAQLTIWIGVREDPEQESEGKDYCEGAEIIDLARLSKSGGCVPSR